MSIVDDYLIKVKKAFPIYGKKEKRFVADFRADVEEHLVNMPSCSEDLLVEKFGSPQEIAVSYYSNLKEDAYYLLVKREHTLKLILISLIIALAVMCSVFAGFCYAAYQKSSSVTGEYYKETIMEEYMDEEINLYNINGNDGL